MAEDKDNKTFEPTAKRLADARKKGEVAVAPEMRHAVMLLSMWVAAASLGLSALASLAQLAAGLWRQAGGLRIGEAGAQPMLAWLLTEVGWRLGPLLGLFMAAAFLIGFVQGKPTLSAARLKPKWSKVNPVQGAKRLFGKQGLVEFAKTLLKSGGVVLVCWLAMRDHVQALATTVGLSPVAVATLAGSLIRELLVSVLLMVGGLALFDFLYQHRAFLARMRMSQQELKDEHKESDGDPAVKARQRQIGAARVRHRMMAAVPSATVVVTNPTHFAVALRYDHGEMRAPVIVAKGTDRIALRIRELAAENKVPVVESPPLARALYASGDVDRPIPIEHYAAVAEIISYVLQLAKSRRS